MAKIKIKTEKENLLLQQIESCLSPIKVSSFLVVYRTFLIMKKHTQYFTVK